MELNLLSTIHCVYEWDKLFKSLSKYKNEIPFILHSFQGNLKQTKKFNELNCFYSISPGCFIEKVC